VSYLQDCSASVLGFLTSITDHPAEDAVLAGLEKFLKANQ
jgi:hypothetical protein